MFHAGERAVQRRAGVVADDWGSAGIGGSIPPVAAAFLEQQPMVVLGAAASDHTVWASLLTGRPGFVRARDDHTVTVDAVPAPEDPLAGLFDAERDIGMLAIEPATRRRMRINGTARRTADSLTVRTEQVYANCPKYIQTRRVGSGGHDAAARIAREYPALAAGHRAWLGRSDTFFIATRAAGQGADVSHRGGNPGFVHVSSDRRLTWPDYIGNSMYMTLGNLELDPHCGLLFVDWERGHTLHLTGRAHVDWDPARAAKVPGAQRLVDFDVERAVEVEHGSPLRWSFEKYSKFNPA